MLIINLRFHIFVMDYYTTMEEIIEKDDLVIVGNRRNAQSCAIDIDCSCMVVCNNAKISEEVIRKAEDQSILLILLTKFLLEY